MGGRGIVEPKFMGHGRRIFIKLGDHDAEARQEYDERVRERDIINARLMEDQLDIKLSKLQPWSDHWWRVVRELDHVRGCLILSGGA